MSDIIKLGAFVLVFVFLLIMGNRYALKKMLKKATKKKTRNKRKPLGSVYDHTRAELMARRHLAKKKKKRGTCA